MVLCILRDHRLLCPKIYCISFSLKIDFVLANSAYFDEMPHYAAFDLGLHCLPKYRFRGFQSAKGYLGLTPFNISICKCMY